MTQRLTIRRPDDMHLHLRDGAVMEAVVPHTSADFARAIIMPNLVPPVTKAEHARAYYERIMASVPDGQTFQPLMTLYLTEATSIEDIDAAVAGGLVKAVKLYPAGATTNSNSGVRDFEKVMPVLERMAFHDLPLLVHGEVTDADIDIFDREAVFIDRILQPLRTRLPQLRIVMEHVTTKDGVSFVREYETGMAATLTVHHLMLNRNALLVGGVRPHYYCLPVLKREQHRLALVEAAVSGDSRFFLGTDSAPHMTHLKENACGCAGVFTAPNAMACLASVFEAEEALDRLEGFASLHGAHFYKLPPNDAKLHLIRAEDPQNWPAQISAGDNETVTLFDPGIPIYWTVQP